MKSLRINLPARILLSVVALIILPQPFSKGCGIKGIEFYGYDFFDPEIVHPEKGMAPYLLDIGEIYEKYIDADDPIKAIVEDPHNYFEDEHFLLQVLAETLGFFSSHYFAARVDPFQIAEWEYEGKGESEFGLRVELCLSFEDGTIMRVLDK